MGGINEFHWTYIKATIPERKHRRAFSGPLGEGVSNTAYIILWSTLPAYKASNAIYRQTLTDIELVSKEDITW